MIIKLLIDGGDMKPGPSIAQQLGPKGINMGKVITEVNLATKHFKGIKVPVELDVNEKTKDFVVRVSSPPTSELLKKELSLEKGTSGHNKDILANASIEDIIKVTQVKHPGMLEKTFKSAVKSVLGTCASIGILVESKDPNELISDVNQGVYDKEINSEKTTTDSDKRDKLSSHLQGLKAAQEAIIAQAKKAEEAAAAVAAEAPAAPAGDKAAPAADKAAKAGSAAKTPAKAAAKAAAPSPKDAKAAKSGKAAKPSAPAKK
jgi:large subunit ribosomal protein L11